VSLLSQEWASGASGENDPEMSTLLPGAADGNQVSCLTKAPSDVVFIAPRDSRAPGLYSGSHAYLTGTVENIPIWSRD
jgi:hypothetical protein